MTNRVTVGIGAGNKITVVTEPKNIIKVETGGGASQGGGSGPKTFRSLIDVDASHLVDGESVVYNANEDKFVVETVPIIDGGTF